jgi:Amt family ammonium transporter
LGTALLWFGWFGFNAGSALAANGLAATAFVQTNVAAAAAGLGWAAIEWIRTQKPTMLGICSGAVAGLVAITPAAGYVTVGGSLAIGFLASVLCYIAAVVLKPKMGYDDALDAFGVHCIGGIWGALATGLFATKLVNDAGNNGLFYGNPGQLWIQAKAVGITLIYSGIVTAVLFKIIDRAMGMRVTRDEENIGLDLTQHQERAYTLME